MNNTKTITKFPAGKIAVPPSKSYSHRAIICAGLAAIGGGGVSTLYNIGHSNDISDTISCMEALGASYVKAKNGYRVSVQKEQVETNPAEIIMNCGESGSTLRFLLPVAAMDNRRYRFTGRGRLLQRPQQVYQDVFIKSNVLFENHTDYILLQGPLNGGSYQMPGDVSSQFLSGLCFALPLAKQNSSVTVTGGLQSKAYAEMTISTLNNFGIDIITSHSNIYEIAAGQKYIAQNYTVEGDYSQAAFYLVAGALGQKVSCTGLLPQSLQGDTGIINVLNAAGAEVNWENGAVYAHASAGGLRAFTVDASEIPDLVPPLAALACFCKGTSHITGAARLRIKESDRLDALATQLSALGADICQGKNSLTITGKPALNGGTVDAVGDHRIAMALAVTAIKCNNPVHLTGWENVSKSYPAFWQDFEKEARHG